MDCHCRAAKIGVGGVVLGTKIVFYNGKYTSVQGFGSFLFCFGHLLVYLMQLKNKMQQKVKFFETKVLELPPHQPVVASEPFQGFSAAGEQII